MRRCFSGYNDERCDPESSLTHLGNGYRAYDPALGRFQCPDTLSPFGNGGVNPYVYCNGDPINHADPSGHMSIPGILSIVGATIGIITGVASLSLPVLLSGSLLAGLATMTPTAIASTLLGIAVSSYSIERTICVDNKPVGEYDSTAIAFAVIGLFTVGLSTYKNDFYGLSRQVWRLGARLSRANFKYEAMARKALGIHYWQRYTNNIFFKKNHYFDSMAGLRSVERVKGVDIPKHSQLLRKLLPYPIMHATLTSEKYAQLAITDDLSTAIQAEHMENLVQYLKNTSSRRISLVSEYVSPKENSIPTYSDTEIDRQIKCSQLINLETDDFYFREVRQRKWTF